MQYLLERLAGAGETVRGRPPVPDLRAAVREQIQRVVTSRFWPGRPGLDLMGLNLPPVAGYGYACQRDVARFAAGIRELVLAHEPRLAGVRVTVEDAGGSLMPFQVEVTGVLLGEDEPTTFRFDLPRGG